MLTKPIVLFGTEIIIELKKTKLRVCAVSYKIQRTLFLN